MTSLYQDLTEAGIKTSNHYSDLYFEDTDEARAIMARHPETVKMASRFKNEIDGQRWVDVPFAFDPYWDARNNPCDMEGSQDYAKA